MQGFKMTVLLKLKRHIAFLLLFPCFCSCLFAQKKPALPVDFFQKFSYTLPTGFNYNDSLQLKKEVINIARELLKIQTEAQQNYTIEDAVSLYTVLSATAATHTILNNHQQVIDAVGKCRQLRPTPAYLIPYGLMELAYSKAFLAQQKNKNSSFKPAFEASLLEQLNQVNIEFRNDIVNRQKGIYNSSSVQTNWRSLTEALDQGINKANRKLDYPTASGILFRFNSYNRAKNYQSVIENVLFAITPSKVKEEQVKIPMRDGIKLNAYIYRDISNTQKLPALISLSPYPLGTEATRGNVFATNGYIYVYVDSRGRRESEGSFYAL